MSILSFRKYPRVDVTIPINLVLEGNEVQAYISNVSEEGTNLVAEKSMPIGTTMEFDIHLPKIDKPTHVKGDVLWSRPVFENGQSLFAHGILYSRLDPSDRDRLHHFVSNEMNY